MRGYRALAIVTAISTFGLILLGGYVKATGAGLACPHWPKCFADRPGLDAWFPPLEGLVAIEWWHRFVASIVGLMILATCVQAWRTQRHDRRILAASTLALGILPIQVVVGGITVTSLLEPLIVVAHLGLATTIFGALVANALFTVYPRPAPAPTAAGAREPDPTQTPPPRGPLRAAVSDFIQMSKPGILFLLLLTGLAAMLITDGPIPSWRTIFFTLLGGGLAASASSAFNNYLERDLDALMVRTAKRPLPANRVTPRAALAFAFACTLGSMAILTWFVNWVAALCALGGLLFYVFVYTIWLKPRTPQNIVIGGAAGAAPALVGWAAVTGDVGVPALLLGAIIFLWTPPHFWALALVYKEDYKTAGFPMLPVVKGERATRNQILLYTVLLVASTLLFVYPLGVLGNLYLASAVVLGAVFLWMAVVVFRETKNRKPAYRLFWYSIVYLGLLYVGMVADRLVARYVLPG